MAPAADDVLKKSAFRCLDAVRYVVAAAVTVLMVAVIMKAVKVVHRPDTLTLWIVGGSVSVQRSENLARPFNSSIGGDNLTFTFDLRAINPSDHVVIYYTNIIGRLRAKNSSSAMNTLVLLLMDDITLVQQVVLDSSMRLFVPITREYQKYYFQALANGSSIANASLKINGTRIVQNVYTGQNMTSEQAIYYCSPVNVDGGEDNAGTAADRVPCTEDPPTSILAN